MTPLPVTNIVRESVLVVWLKRGRLCRALAGTGLTLAALDMAQNAVDRLDWQLNFLLVFLNAMVFTLFAVTCHRIVLLSEAETPVFGIHSWSQRETRFLGWTVTSAFYFMMIGLAMAMFADVFSPSSFKHKGLSPLFYAALIPGAYVFARLSVLLPATAVDERRDIKWAWDATSSNGWRLVLVVTLLPGVLGTAVSFFEMRQYPIVEFVGHFLSYALVAIEIAVLSVSFRFLRRTFAESKPDALVGSDH
jgi:hypothetical protein